MNPELTPLIIQFFLKFLVASVVGSGSYLLWRFLEKKWPLLIPIGVVSVILFIAGNTSFFFSDAVGYIISFLSSVAIILGSSFHRKLSDESKTNYQAAFLLFAASGTSFFIGSTIYYAFPLRMPGTPLATSLMSLAYYLFLFYFFALLIYPPITPFLVWAWQSLKLRPGIDKPLSD